MTIQYETNQHENHYGHNNQVSREILRYGTKLPLLTRNERLITPKKLGHCVHVSIMVLMLVSFVSNGQKCLLLHKILRYGT